jgi:type II secretory pathway component PulF
MSSPAARRLSVVPLAICAALWLVMSGAMLFVVPVFEKMFRDFGGELPWSTRAVIALAAFMRVNFLFGGALALVPVFAPAIAGAWLQAHGNQREGTWLIALGLAGGMIAIAAMVIALYQPIFALAGNIQ